MEDNVCFICEDEILNDDYICYECRTKVNRLDTIVEKHEKYNLDKISNLKCFYFLLNQLKENDSILSTKVYLLIKHLEWHYLLDRDCVPLIDRIENIKEIAEEKEIIFKNEATISEPYEEKYGIEPPKKTYHEIEQDFYNQRIKCEDGHFVRSREEKIIDDFLYRHSILHSYEYELYTGEMFIHPDWYLPEYDIYIEHWGVTDNQQYEETRKLKLEAYKKLKADLIETTKDDINNIEKILKQKLDIHF